MKLSMPVRAPLRRAVLRAALVSAPTSLLLTWVLRAQAAALVAAVGLKPFGLMAVVLGVLIGMAAGYVAAVPLWRDGERRRVVVGTASAGAAVGWVLFPGLALATDPGGLGYVVKALYTDVPVWLASAAAGGWLAVLTGNRPLDR